jgi:hypothetical protein
MVWPTDSCLRLDEQSLPSPNRTLKPNLSRAIQWLNLSFSRSVLGTTGYIPLPLRDLKNDKKPIFRWRSDGSNAGRLRRSETGGRPQPSGLRGLDACAQFRNLVSVGSGETAVNSSGRNTSPLCWSMGSTASISSGGERELRTGEHGGVLRDDSLRQARANKSLMDRKHDQRLVSGRRKKAGDQHVGIDNCPDNLASRPVDSFSCRCAAISALISSGVNASSPRRLAPAHAFVSQSGQRRSRSDEVLHAHDDDGRFAATSTMKRSLLSTTKSMS